MPLIVAPILLLAFLLFTLPVAVSLGLLAFSLDQLFARIPLLPVIGNLAWQTSTEVVLVAVPMFVLIGEILLRSGIAEKMYGALAKWLGRLPGGLMHANIASCTLFAATSGSSVATAATVATVALPEIERHGYNERLFLGSIAAGGTLGIVIPPSIPLLIYAVLTGSSVVDLYLAGMIPGLLLAGAFGFVIVIACLLRPAWGGRPIRSGVSAMLWSLAHLLPPLFIFVVVVGSIYAGIATPTEAASLGVVAALGLAAATGKLSLTMLGAAVEGTLRTTAMVMLIIIASVILNFALVTVGVSDAVEMAVNSLGLAPLQLLLILIIFYFILGCFMETLSMMIITVPIFAPLLFAAGFDPVWFGIVLMLLMETALITPPVGVNLYVVQGVRSGGSMNDVMIGVLPFVAALLCMIALLVAFPQLALWLPELVKR